MQSRWYSGPAAITNGRMNREKWNWEFCAVFCWLTTHTTSSCLKITDRSFRYASPGLWNQLPLSLCQPHSDTSSSISDSPIPSLNHPSRLPLFDSLCSSITPSLFHSRLKTYLFHKFYPSSFTSSSRTAFTDFCPDRFFSATRFLFLVFPCFLVSVPCEKLSWRLAISSAFERT